MLCSNPNSPFCKGILILCFLMSLFQGKGQGEIKTCGGERVGVNSSVVILLINKEQVKRFLKFSWSHKSQDIK